MNFAQRKVAFIVARVTFICVFISSMLESSFEVGVVTQFSALSGFYPSETASRVERSLEGENIFIQEGNFMIQAVHDIY